MAGVVARAAVLVAGVQVYAVAAAAGRTRRANARANRAAAKVSAVAAVRFADFPAAAGVRCIASLEIAANIAVPLTGGVALSEPIRLKPAAGVVAVGSRAPRAIC